MEKKYKVSFQKKIICPYCKHVHKTDRIMPGKGYGTCQKCKNEFTISVIVKTITGTQFLDI